MKLGYTSLTKVKSPQALWQEQDVGVGTCHSYINPKLSIVCSFILYLKIFCSIYTLAIVAFLPKIHFKRLAI